MATRVASVVTTTDDPVITPFHYLPIIGTVLEIRSCGKIDAKIRELITAEANSAIKQGSKIDSLIAKEIKTGAIKQNPRILQLIEYIRLRAVFLQEGQKRSQLTMAAAFLGFMSNAYPISCTFIGLSSYFMYERFQHNIMRHEKLMNELVRQTTFGKEVCKKLRISMKD